MATAAQMRKLALVLPEAEEKSHFEQPDFRVRNKIFAGLSRDGTEGNLKLAPELQALVLSSIRRRSRPRAVRSRNKKLDHPPINAVLRLAPSSSRSCAD
jgi:hypothetical protein